MATIYDVARLAKVSTTTVSKVLSNTPYVSEPTKQRVLDAVRTLQFSPSLMARSLTSNSTYIIGLIIPCDPEASFNDPFVMEIIHGVEKTASLNDYNLLLSMSKKSNQRGAYDQFLRKGYVDGLITVESYKGGISDKELDMHSAPRISVGYREDLKEINSVHSDDYAGAYKAVNYLLELGHRRIGIISGPENFVVAVDERMRGAQCALAEYAITLNERLLVYGDFTIETGYQAGSQLLDREEPPTAIFAMNDRMAVGAMHYAKQQGLEIPRDLSFVGFDDVPLTAMVDPPLTTIRQRPERLGSLATEKLFALIHHEIPSFESIVLPIELIIRASTAAHD